MYWYRWHIRDLFSTRHATTMLLLAAVVAAFLPLPLRSSLPKNAKDRSQPFPCQDRPCGCRTAEQCKQKCCCFSKNQKLAWAKRNAVKASEVVTAEAKTKSETAATRRGCCSTSRVAQSRTKNSDRWAKSTTNAAPHHQIVIGVIAQECQGVAQTAFGQAVFVQPVVISLKPPVESTWERLILKGTRFAQRSTEPPVPPPRLVAA